MKKTYILSTGLAIARGLFGCSSTPYYDAGGVETAIAAKDWATAFDKASLFYDSVEPARIAEGNSFFAQNGNIAAIGMKLSFQSTWDKVAA